MPSTPAGEEACAAGCLAVNRPSSGSSHSSRNRRRLPLQFSNPSRLSLSCFSFVIFLSLSLSFLHAIILRLQTGPPPSPSFSLFPSPPNCRCPRSPTSLLPFQLSAVFHKQRERPFMQPSFWPARRRCFPAVSIVRFIRKKKERAGARVVALVWRSLAYARTPASDSTNARAPTLCVLLAVGTSQGGEPCESCSCCYVRLTGEKSAWLEQHLPRLPHPPYAVAHRRFSRLPNMRPLFPGISPPSHLLAIPENASLSLFPDSGPNNVPPPFPEHPGRGGVAMETACVPANGDAPTKGVNIGGFQGEKGKKKNASPRHRRLGAAGVLR